MLLLLAKCFDCLLSVFVYVRVISNESVDMISLHGREGGNHETKTDVDPRKRGRQRSRRPLVDA